MTPYQFATLLGMCGKIKTFSLYERVSFLLFSSCISKSNIYPTTNFFSCTFYRLIIDSKSYTIVHSNASFSRLSGISNNQLMGSSLSNFVGEELNHMKADIILSGETSSSTNDDNQTLVEGLVKTITCKITVFQVLSKCDDKVPQYSHFVLDFEKLAAPSSLPAITADAAPSITEVEGTKPAKPTETKSDGATLSKNDKGKPIHAIG